VEGRQYLCFNSGREVYPPSSSRCTAVEKRFQKAGSRTLAMAVFGCSCIYTLVAVRICCVVEGLAVDMLVNTRLGIAGFGVGSGMRAEIGAGAGRGSQISV